MLTKNALVWIALLLHVLLWLALAVAAYHSAGNYRFASCWHIAAIYLPPLGALLMAVAAYAAVILLPALFRRSMRSSLYFQTACHAAVFTLGWNACSLAAYSATGPVNCL